MVEESKGSNNNNNFDYENLIYNLNQKTEDIILFIAYRFQE